MTRIAVLDTVGGACARLAHEMATHTERALRERGRADLSLAGGETPRRAYELLASMRDDWHDVHLWFGDERCVDPVDVESNHRMVAQTLLHGIASRGVAPPLVHRMPGELGPDDGADAYAQELARELGATPVLDLSVLGLGPDGHTASLFPGHEQIHERRALCVGVPDAPKPPPQRLTLTLPVLNAARATVLLAAGAQKADALKVVLDGPDERMPASLLASDRLLVVADRAAAP